jgi:hypothetical protein
MQATYLIHFSSGVSIYKYLIIVEGNGHTPHMPKKKVLERVHALIKISELKINLDLETPTESTNILDSLALVVATVKGQDWTRASTPPINTFTSR